MRCTKFLNRWSGQRGDKRSGAGVVPERFADVRKTVDVTGSEYETTAQLERILAQFVLVMSGVAGAFAGFFIVAAQKMEKVCGFQFHSVVGLTKFVNEKGKRDAGFLAKFSRIHRVTEADGGQGRSLLTNGGFVFAQLRDVLAAKDSAVVTQEDHDGRLSVPEGAEPDIASIGIGQG